MNILPSKEFPSLSPSSRPREFNTYTEKERSKVVYAYLVDGLDYRSIDTNVLKLKFDSRGWQSMGICHYLGLHDKHKGFFKGWKFDDVLLYMKGLKQTDAICLILYYLECAISDFHGRFGRDDVILTEARDKFWIKNTLLFKEQEKNYDFKLLKLPNVIADHEEFEVRKDVRCYISSSILKQSIKSLYDYRCQVCGDVVLKTGWASTLSRSESWSYLSSDIHHILPLSKGGPDSRDNMICLCPTCHRKFHSGEFRLKTNGDFLILSDELLGKTQNIVQKHKLVLF